MRQRASPSTVTIPRSIDILWYSREVASKEHSVGWHLSLRIYLVGWFEQKWTCCPRRVQPKANFNFARAHRSKQILPSVFASCYSPYWRHKVACAFKVFSWQTSCMFMSTMVVVAEFFNNPRKQCITVFVRPNLGWGAFFSSESSTHKKGSWILGQGLAVCWLHSCIESETCAQVSILVVGFTFSSSCSSVSYTLINNDCLDFRGYFLGEYGVFPLDAIVVVKFRDKGRGARVWNAITIATRRRRSSQSWKFTF